MAGYVSDAVIRRLPGYYRHLRELEAAGVNTRCLTEQIDQRGHAVFEQKGDVLRRGGGGRVAAQVTEAPGQDAARVGGGLKQAGHGSGLLGKVHLLYHAGKSASMQPAR